MKIPRKKKKQIPKGTPYCYTSNGFINTEDDGLHVETKDCPFYAHEDDILGYCRLLKCEVLDQVKECGVKY